MLHCKEHAVWEAGRVPLLGTIYKGGEVYIVRGYIYFDISNR